jgi:hypothetical protein
MSSSKMMSSPTNQISLDLRKVIQNKKNPGGGKEEENNEQMLNQSPDLPSDEQGNTELMKDYSLLTGKYKDKMFSETYVEKKGYVDWIRKNVVSHNSKFSVNMLEFRLYIETRDQHKILRLKREKAEKEAIYISTLIPRKAVQRRSNVECDWEVMMMLTTIPESKEYVTAEIQDLQGKLDNINQVIQNAIQHKIMIEDQVKDLVSRMTQQNP